MPRPFGLIGAPTSAGSYAPGQEKAPDAMRRAGLVNLLREKGADCTDYGDTERFRWRADREHPRAMNIEPVVRITKDVERLAGAACDKGRIPLVIGGDCTVEIGTVSAFVARSDSLGLIYIDGDADMRTPETTTDGALDWMGVAHMLGLPGTVVELAEFGPGSPLLSPDELLLFGAGNIKPDEQDWIDKLDIALVGEDAVRANPVVAAQKAVAWGARFEKLLIHLDVDVLDFEDFPLAENTRRKCGLTFGQAMDGLAVLVDAPNFAGLTVCEINPDHGIENGKTVRMFAERLSELLTAT